MSLVATYIGLPTISGLAGVYAGHKAYPVQYPNNAAPSTTKTCLTSLFGSINFAATVAGIALSIGAMGTVYENEQGTVFIAGTLLTGAVTFVITAVGNKILSRMQ